MKTHVERWIKVRNTLTMFGDKREELLKEFAALEMWAAVWQIENTKMQICQDADRQKVDELFEMKKEELEKKTILAYKELPGYMAETIDLHVLKKEIRTLEPHHNFHEGTWIPVSHILKHKDKRELSDMREKMQEWI